MRLKYGTKPADVQAETEAESQALRRRLAPPLGRLAFFLMLGLAAVILADRLFAPQFATRSIQSAGWTIAGLLACLATSLICFILAWRAAHQIKTALEDPSET